jgi:hypothetical protein
MGARVINAITTTTARPEPMTALMPTSLDEAARLAKIMSDMSLVPAHLQGKPADCMLVIESALRWRMSPFAVAQATSVLQGKLNFEGKLVAAALHTSGVLATRLRYDYEGDNGGRAVRVSALVHGETEPREVLVKLADVKTNNKMWTQQVDQQLAYAGARIWARRHAPEVMLGVYAPEEFEPEPEREARPVQATVMRDTAKALPERPRRELPSHMTRPTLDPVAAQQRAAEGLNRMTREELDAALDGDEILPEPPVDKVQQGIDALEARYRACTHSTQVVDIMGEPQVVKQLSWLDKHRPEDAKRLRDQCAS